MSEKITITETGEFNCLCGNHPNAQGAYACDRDGRLVEPSPGAGDLFRCDRCGRIFDGHTGEVVGQLGVRDGRCADCGAEIPEGQRLCNCNTSGDLG